MRAFLSIAVFVCASMLNPAYVMGCGTGRTFNFSELEMLALAERTTGSYPFELGGVEYVLTLDLKATRPRPKTAAGSLFAGSAHACETRTILPTAAACIDSSEVAIEGSMMLTRSAPDGSRAGLERPLAVAGDMSVFGSRLDNGSVDLRGEDVRIALDSDGSAFTLGSFELKDADEVIEYRAE